VHKQRRMEVLRIYMERLPAALRSGTSWALGIGCSLLSIVMLSCCGCLGLAMLVSPSEQTENRFPRRGTSIAAVTPEEIRERVVEQVTVVVTATPENTRLPTPSLTPEPSDSPTPSPTATATWTPSSTPSPTSTPEPTNTPTPSATSTPAASPTPRRTKAQVVEVVDGDTIKVSVDGEIHSLRYIGIDTPELSEPMGSTCCAANEQLVAGQTVYLEKDQSDTDQYGRLLRYVYLPSGLLVNAELVRQGYAKSVTYPPDTSRQETLDAVEHQARGAALGLWAPTPTPIPPTFTPVPPSPTPLPPSPTRVPPTAVPPSPVPTQPPQQNCDPSYPDVCIPPPPPDLDCGEIGYTNFRVVGSDPHGFDGDNDGIGCER